MADSNPVDAVQNAASEAAGGQSLNLELSLNGDGQLNAISVNGEAVLAEPAQQTVEKIPVVTGNGPLDRLIDALLNTWQTFIDHLPVICISLTVLVIFGLLASGIRQGVTRLMMRVSVRRGLGTVIGNLLFLGIWFSGILVAISILDPNISVSRILAVIGIASLAFSFVFRDIMENFFAGFLLLWQFPFERGDYVEIETEQGTLAGAIEDVQLRMTLIREISNELLVVPNAAIYKAPLRVSTSKPLRRDTVTIQVAYSSDLKIARQVLIEAAQTCELVESKPQPNVFATEFADSGCEFTVHWWTGSEPLAMWLARDQMVEALKSGLDTAGIEIPYPHRKLIGLSPENSQPTTASSPVSHNKRNDSSKEDFADQATNDLGEASPE